MEKKVNELLALLKRLNELTDDLNSEWCLLTTDEQATARPLMQTARDALKNFKQNR